MVQAPGAFICLGLILACMNVINVWQARRKGLKDPAPIGCNGCGCCNAMEKE